MSTRDRVDRRKALCASCGELRWHQGHGLCSRCYGRLPARRARTRWNTMIRRCTNPDDLSYRWYGARGIKVCDRWLESFGAYYRDVGDAPEGMTLDRINNDGDYEPGNVRWATPKTQSNNRRNPLAERTHCKHGHLYDEANTYVDPSTRARKCRLCRRATVRRYLDRKAAA